MIVSDSKYWSVEKWLKSLGICIKKYAHVVEPHSILKGVVSGIVGVVVRKMTHGNVINNMQPTYHRTAARPSSAAITT